jgi:hypothetical protein
MTLDRRRFLQITAAGVVATLTTSALAGEVGFDASALERPELLTMLGPERVRELGIRYRAAKPSERTASSLRAAISKGEPGTLGLRWSSRGSIEKKIQDDFAAGQTVLVDGWVLSVTEARQCALFSLATA